MHSESKKAKQTQLKARMRLAVAALALPRAEDNVLSALVDIWQFDGLYPKHETIAERARYSDRHVRTQLAKLRLRDLVSWTQRRFAGNVTSNLYRFTSRFWDLVRTAGNPFRQQSEAVSVSSRKPLPANSPDPGIPSSREVGTPDVPPPGLEENVATETPEAQAAELRSLFESERAKAYPSDPDPGTMRAARELQVVSALDGVTVEAVAVAHATGHSVEASHVRRTLWLDAVRRWLAQTGAVSSDAPRGFLIERAHKYGLLAGDFGRVVRQALDAWIAQHRPRRPPLPLVPPSSPRRVRGDQPALTFRVPSTVAA